MVVSSYHKSEPHCDLSVGFKQGGLNSVSAQAVLVQSAEVKVEHW